MAGDLLGPLTLLGAREVQEALDALTADVQDRLAEVADAAVEMVADRARPRVPTRSGRARSSVRTRRAQQMAQVVGGGPRAPYYPWLDFGGQVGRRRSVVRPYRREGRYIYPAYAAAQGDVQERLAAEVRDMARDAGWEVTG